MYNFHCISWANFYDSVKYMKGDVLLAPLPPPNPKMTGFEKMPTMFGGKRWQSRAEDQSGNKEGI